MLLMLASVKLNQTVRASGQAATSSRVISIGARNIQAVRVLLFMARGLPLLAAADLVQLAFQLLQAGIGFFFA